MEYQLSEKDYYKAYLLHRKPRKAYAVLGIVILCLSSIPMFYGSNPGWYRFFWPLCVIYLLLLFFVFPYYQISKIYKQTRGLGNEIINISLDENSITLSTDKGNSTIPFKDIYKLKNNKHYLLIYPNQHLYRILPKKDDELKELAKQIEDGFIKNSR